MHLPAREEEPAEQVLRLRALQPGRVLRDGEHRPALVELDLVLREVRRLDAVPEPELPGRRLPAAEQRLEERRLPRAVRPDEGDVLAALDRERHVREELLVARASATPSASTTVRPLRFGWRNSKPRLFARRVSSEISPPSSARSFSRRPICVSFACARLARFFL